MRMGNIALAALIWMATLAEGYAADAPALTGIVSSATESKMEGVLVTAQKQGSTISVTVVSDRDGRFAFPADRLGEGKYALRVRALGFELDGPQTADVPAGKTASLDIKLKPAADMASQMTSTEWLMSMPGAPEQKAPLIECMSCHTLERVVRSKFNAEDFGPVLKRMSNYANNSTQAKVQARVENRVVPEDRVKKVADYLSTANLSKSDKWTWPLQTLPRPSGKATRVIVTEYDMPRNTIAPHDVRTDKDGNVWYSNFVENFIGKLDPRTGGHEEWAYPQQRDGFPSGSLALEPDPDGNYWLALMFQTGVARFNVATKSFDMFPIPESARTIATQQSMVQPRQWKVDGKVWSNEVSKQGILRLDVASKTWEFVDPFKAMPMGRPHSPYGLAADAENNLYFMDFADENIGKVEARTFRPTVYPTPTRFSRPRRTMLDGEGRLWFAEFAANKLAMFDTKKESFREWAVPTPHSYPYDAYLDKTGMLWSGNMSNDRIIRFNPQTGDSTEYLLPRSTNIRRIFLDDSTTPPTFWAGNNHGASILKLEVLD